MALGERIDRHGFQLERISQLVKIAEIFLFELRSFQLERISQLVKIDNAGGQADS